MLLLARGKLEKMVSVTFVVGFSFAKDAGYNASWVVVEDALWLLIFSPSSSRLRFLHRGIVGTSSATDGMFPCKGEEMRKKKTAK